ncbi:MAG: DUF2141 domain-containing protein [Sphingobium sp.]
MQRAFILAGLIAGISGGAFAMPSTPDLGKREGQCRPDERGPAFLVTPVGIKDRRGTLKLEVYPANDDDFLNDDNLLLMAGKTFRRVEEPVPVSGPIRLCVRVPEAGRYAVSLLHDRNGDHKFKWTVDGIGFANNPRLGWSKPKASRASALAGDGITPISIVLNYRHGLGVAPLKN